MSQEPVKVIIEVNGGVVQAVYAGNEAQPMIECVVVDHDSAEVRHVRPEPLKQFDPCFSYDGGYPLHWYNDKHTDLVL